MRLFVLITSALSVSTGAFAADVGCPAGTEPMMILSASKGKMSAWPEDRLPPAEESYLNCYRRGANGAISDFHVQRREDAKDFFTRTAEIFQKKSIRISRDFPIYGEVFLSVFFCQDCDWNRATQKVGFTILRKFSLFGKGASDYRTLKDIALNQSSTPPTLTTRRGGIFDVVTLEVGTWGITGARLSVCDPAGNETRAQCLLNPQGKLRTIETIDLSRAIRVKNP